jgi:translation initiation factor 2 beta subunit (eIF-2beta)/eIF-5
VLLDPKFEKGGRVALDPAARSEVRLALSRRGAAEALGVSLSHFQRHVQPYVRCVYCGRLRLYPVKELERWIAEECCVSGRAR